jgi:hypothetical protein
MEDEPRPDAATADLVAPGEVVAADQAGDEVDENTDPDTLLDRLKAISGNAAEHKGYLAAAAVVGAAAVVALVIAKKRGVSFSTAEGHRLFISTDRHSPETVSLVEFSGSTGATSDLAASFPTSTRAAGIVQGDPNTKTLFTMGGEDGFAYPLQGDEHSRAYMRTTRRAATWLVHSFRSLKDKDSEQTPDA